MSQKSEEFPQQQKMNTVKSALDAALTEIEAELCHSSFVNPAVAMMDVILNQGGSMRQAELAVKAFYKGVLELRGYRGIP